jgi:hypothetical protein
MRSHHYDFDLKDVLRAAGTPVFGLLLFALCVHLGAWLKLLPSPRPTLDLDRSILVHKVEAARARSAEIVLIGDSSCLMNVLADDLGVRLGRSVLNLGTLSYLDLRAYAQLLQEHTRANSNQLRTVVLLMHPEALRRVDSEPYHAKLFDDVLAARDFCPPAARFENLTCWLGLESVRARLLARVVPAPLPDAYGHFYGFTADLERFMDEHDGSLIEPVRKAFKGNAEYRLAATLDSQSRAFASTVPAGVKLVAGITPVPASFVGQDYSHQYGEMLTEWSRWLAAEPLELPPTLPDASFGGVTHLTASGAREYTSALADRLAARLRASLP